MIVICRKIAGVQRRKEVRTQEASRYKKTVHFLKNAGRNERVSTPKIEEQLEGVITSWRRQKEGQNQDMEGNRPRERNLLSGDRRGGKKSGHGNQRRAPTFWRPQGDGQSGHGKKATKPGTLTFWRPQREGKSGRGKKATE